MQVNKHLLLFILLTLLAINTSLSIEADDLSLSLDLQPRYGASQIITGTLTITAGELSSEASVKAYINNNKKAELTFQQLLDSVLLPYTASQPEYSLASGQLSSSSSSKIIGFKIPSNVIKASIRFSGTTSNLSVDVGNDKHLDWQYFNPSGVTFTDAIQLYPEGASSSTQLPSERAVVSQEFERCEEIYIDFNPLLNSPVIQVVSQVIKSSPGSNLKARIYDLGNCDLPEPDPIETLQTVGCEIKLLSPESGLYNVCIYIDSGSSTTTYYKVPVTTLENSQKYYFITVRKAIFPTNLDGTATFSGSKFVDAINNYFNTCQLDNSGLCLVPIKTLSSQQVSISDLEILDDQGIIYSSLYDLKYTPPIISLFDTIKIPLESLNLTAPSSIRRLNELEITLAGKSASANFDTVSAPVAKIFAIKPAAALLESIIFDGSRSLPSSNSNIASYFWDFGDGNKLTTTQSSASHAFSSAGRQVIKLTVSDAAGVKSSPASATIDVLTGEQSIDSLLDSTKRILNSTQAYLATANKNVQDVAASLRYNAAITSAQSDLIAVELKVANIKNSDLSHEQKEAEYATEINKIKSIQDKIPSILLVTNKLVYTQALDYAAIPNPKTIDPTVQQAEAAKLAIYSMLNQHVIQMDAKLVRVRYISGKDESFILVKKFISSQTQPDYIIEYSPAGFLSLITEGTKINNNYVKYPSTKEIVYTMPGSLLDAKSTLTLTIPDLTNLPEPPKAECGDSICSYSEELGIDEANPDSQDYCELDCKRELRLGSIIAIIILAALGIYYINFYHGPGNFKDATNYLSVLLFKRRLFTSKQDLINLTNFVRASLSKGFTKQQVSAVLAKKGWTDQQIQHALKSSGK